ncbi:MAG: hypothetical protein Q9O24_01750 [Gammaproteobacteria bacterium]|nr:hypothetical protein [Gammaproteobacteria bacterium]
MIALATFAMRGPFQAALVSSMLLLFSLMLPPLVWLSNAILALVCLREGLPAAFKALGMALLATLLVTATVNQLLLMQALSLMLFNWLPMLLVAYLLRSRVSLAISLHGVAALAVVLVLMIFLLVPDQTRVWSEMLSPFMVDFFAELKLSADEQTEMLAELSSMMTAAIAAMLVVSLTVSLLIARWWQARLYNQGGFQQEFHNLRLGLRASLLAVAVLLLSLLVGSPLLAALASVAVTLFLFQGLAVVHAIVVLKKVNGRWLVVLYAGLLFMLPQVSMALAGLGMVDAWGDIRARISKGVSSNH